MERVTRVNPNQRKRARTTSVGPLFPEWKAKGINELIKSVAALNGWDTSYQWSSHSIRHGAAMQYTEEFLEKMRRAGGWANSSAYRYMRLRLQRRADGTDEVEFEELPDVEKRGASLERHARASDSASRTARVHGTPGAG
jgi:hypothetical protein